MRNTLLAGAAALVLSAAAAEAAPIVGSINFAGSNTYNTTTNMVDFINPQTVTSDTIGFAPCIGCGVIAGPTGGVFDYSSAFSAPSAKPLVYDDLLDAVANGKIFSFDLQTVTQIIEQPNVSVAIQGTGLLHLTGVDDTRAASSFRRKGPRTSKSRSRRPTPPFRYRNRELGRCSARACSPSWFGTAAGG